MSEQTFFGSKFNCPVRYTKLEPIGLGAFGLVCSAVDTINKEQVAIKKISNPFENNVLAKRAYRELLLLSHLRHENVIGLRDVFLSSTPNDMYFVTDLLGADLHRLLQIKPLEGQYIKFFLYQILQGLKYVHAAGVIHRDLKPANILVNESCDIKICDFGLARVSENVMTGYVATRYYRAPEIMLTWQHYDNGVDIWSTGCILAEMLEGKKIPLFHGKDNIDQFSAIARLLGSPPIDVVQSISSETTLKFVKSLKTFESFAIEKRFADYDQVAVDLMLKMLLWNPKKRIDAESALLHPYFDEYRDNTCDEEPVEPFDWSFTEQKFTNEEWKIKVESLISRFKANQ